jgi:hypothetical protein
MFYSINRFSPLFGLLAFLFAPLYLSLDDGAGGGGGGDGGAGDGGGDGGGGDGGDAGGGGGDGAAPPATLAAGKGAPAPGKGAPPADGKGTPPGDGKGTPPGDGKGAPPGTGTGDPWFVGLWDKSGKIDAKKYDALPDSLKAHKDLFGKYQTAEAFFHGMVNHQQLASKKGLQPLAPNAPAEVVAERNALMRQLNGAPEKPEGYGVKKPDKMADEHWNGEYVNGMVGILHKHNASPALVKELLEADVAAGEKIRSGYGAQTEQALAKEATTLQEAFGEGDSYTQKLNLAQRAAKTLGLDINDPQLGNSAKFVIALSKVGEMIGEDRMVGGEDKGGTSTSDRAKAIDIVKNPANPLHAAYHNANDPRHDEAVAQHSAFNKAHAAKKKK